METKLRPFYQMRTCNFQRVEDYQPFQLCSGFSLQVLGKSLEFDDQSCHLVPLFGEDRFIFLFGSKFKVA